MEGCILTDKNTPQGNKESGGGHSNVHLDSWGDLVSSQNWAVVLHHTSYTLLFSDPGKVMTEMEWGFAGSGLASCLQNGPGIVSMQW